MTAIRNWTPQCLTDQTGKTFAITGANSGIGFQAARLLAKRGARVILLCRDPDRASGAAQAIAAEVKGGEGSTDIIAIDLGNLASIRAAAAELLSRVASLDGLVLNAGAMMPPERLETSDGFELQFGVNHLGHFLLAALVQEKVRACAGRFVSVSSTMHKLGKIRTDDPNWRKSYDASAAYSQSKLANALFILALNEKLSARGEAANGYLCHPGYAATPLQTKHTRGLTTKMMEVGNLVMAQSAARGSWPTVLCTADPDANPGVYYGPTGLFELRGGVGVCKLAARAEDRAMAEKLWTLSEEAVDHRWAL
ncbi:MAG: oxidoreductase [Pseudomonadota bacterium]